MSKQKTRRNQRLYQFWKEHKEKWSVSAIARLFKISQPRAREIIKTEESKIEQVKE